MKNNELKMIDVDDQFELRLRYLIKTVGGTAAASKILKKSSATVERYKAGSDISFKGAFRLTKAAGLTTEWLATGRMVPDAIPALLEGQPAAKNRALVNIPMIKAAASAGGGALVADEDAAAAVAFNEQYLRSTWNVSPAELFCMPADGESMEPTIKSGEFLLVSRADHHKTPGDGIYIVRLEGDLLVKRIQRLPGGRVMISSDNPAYKPYEIKLDDGTDFTVLGKVVLVHGVRRV